MGDGHETESAVERLLDSWSADALTLRDLGHPREAQALALCIRQITAALEEDGVIPTRK